MEKINVNLYSVPVLGPGPGSSHKSSDGGYLSTSNQGIYTVRPKALVVTLPVVVSARQILVVTALATK